jgi:hypothetical protein
MMTFDRRNRLSGASKHSALKNGPRQRCRLSLVQG